KAGVEGDFKASNNQWTAWQWTTSTHTLHGLAPFVGLSPVASEDMALVEANRSGAMFVEFRFDPVTFDFSIPSHVLTATQAFRFADDITGPYRLLDVPFAYNVDDGRFHRVNATLDVLPGPRRLAAGGAPIGALRCGGLPLPALCVGRRARPGSASAGGAPPNRRSRRCSRAGAPPP